MAGKLMAFADESVRVKAASPMYLIAATMLPDDAELEKLEAMLPKAARKLHWRDLGERAQREALAAISQLSPQTTIVVAAPIDPRRQERARRKVLETLLPILEAEGVEELVMESRFPAADSKDIALYRSMRKKGIISEIAYRFADPAAEHRLWVPDQILGAYADAAVGSRSASAWEHEWKALYGSVTVVEANIR